MWIRISSDLETDEHEIINSEHVRYIGKSTKTFGEKPVPCIDFRIPETTMYWPFRSSVHRDKEYERIYSQLTERNQNGKNY